MKTLDVGWIKEAAVDVEITRENSGRKTPATNGASIPASTPPENLIVITCSGGVLRHWPARDGNSVW